MDFLSSIKSLENANPNEVLAKLHVMFSAITNMDANQVVSAYQTLKTTAQLINKSDDHLVRTMLKAMENQMIAIGSRVGNSCEQKRFNQVTGSTLFLGRSGFF